MSRKILIAEDDKMLLQTMTFYLGRQGYQISKAEDGESAVKQIKETQFDLVITDINMPYVGGMEIVHLVRNELKRNTPVIVLTSSGLEKTQLNAFNLGASEFITKPFSLPVLAARIAKLLPA